MADKNETQPEQPEQPNTPPPAGMNAEEFNRAFTERLKRERAAWAKEAEAREAKLLAIIEEGKARAADPHPSDEPDKKAERLAAKAVKEAEARMKAEIDKLQAERQAERAKAQAAEERAMVEGALRDAGVTNVKGALAFLKAEGLVGRDEAGELKFFQQKEGYRDELEVVKGVKDWLATEDGKFYMPPVGAGGSGATAARGGRRTVGNSPAERQAEAAAVLDQWIGGAKK